MVALQFEQPAKQPIVIGIADQRIVQHIITVIVLLDLPAQLGHFLPGVGAGRFCHRNRIFQRRSRKRLDEKLTQFTLRMKVTETLR